MAQNNMRKMFTEQQIIDLVKQNGIGGTQLYLHKLHNSTNTIEIYLISNIKEEYTNTGTPHTTDTITLKSHEENDKSIIGFNDMTGMWITYEMGVGVGYYSLDWSNITDSVTPL